MIGGVRIVRDSGTSSTIGGRKRDASRGALRTGAYFGRSTDSTKPAVVATSSCTNHEPAARITVLRKYWSMWISVQARTTLSRLPPLGKKARGVEMVSCVGVNADLAS